MNYDDKFITVTLFTASLYPGMILKGDLYTENGEKVFDALKPITIELIEKLNKKNIKQVYYQRPVLSVKNYSEKSKIPLDLLEKAYTVSEEISYSIINKSSLPKKSIEGTVDKFIEHLSITEMGAILNLLELKEYDEYTYTHSVNVSLISLLFAKLLGWNEDKLRMLGIGAMLHDMGKLLIPKEILNKNGKLTPEEFEVMKKHTIYGREIIKNQADYGESIQNIALLHHEWYNGKGYPLGLTGDKIGEMPQIVCIADCFDAITSKRSYKIGFPFWFAFLDLYKNMGTKYNPKLATEFINMIPSQLMIEDLFTVGTFLSLNTGEIAEVIRPSKHIPFKPTILIYINSNGKELKYPIEVNLEKDPSNRRIDSVVEDKMLLEILNEMRNKDKINKLEK